MDFQFIRHYKLCPPLLTTDGRGDELRISFIYGDAVLSEMLNIVTWSSILCICNVVVAAMIATVINALFLFWWLLPTNKLHFLIFTNYTQTTSSPTNDDALYAHTAAGQLSVVAF